MLEYVFFHQVPFDQFITFLNGQELSPETSQEDDCYEVRLPDDLDDALSDRIEEKYDTLMEMNQELFYAENPDSAENYVVAGIDLRLKDGMQATALVDPGVIARILEVVTGDEFDTLIETIIKAVEDPDGKSFCETIQEKRAKGRPE